MKGSDTRFIVEGQRINKTDLQRYLTIDRKAMRQQEQAEKADREDEATGTSSTGARRHSCNISLVQLTESSHGVTGDSESGTEASLHEPVHNASVLASTLSHSQERSAAHNSSHKNDKIYRGLRHSTVQIYNGR